MDYGKIAAQVASALSNAAVSAHLSDSTIEFIGDTWSEETLNSMVGGGFFRKFRAWRRKHADVTDRDRAFEQFMQSEGYPDLGRAGPSIPYKIHPAWAEASPDDPEAINIRPRSR